MAPIKLWTTGTVCIISPLYEVCVRNITYVIVSYNCWKELL